MLQRLMLMLFVLLIPFSGKAQDVPSDLLAFSLLEAHGAAETIYVYDPHNRTVQEIGTGDSVRWSPSGRYLAMTDTVNTDPTAGKFLGQIISFSVYDFETGITNTWEYDYGDYVAWPPDETYMIATGSVSSGLNGSNAWVNFFHADGSGEAPQTGPGYVDGIMGSRGGVFPLGWVGSGADRQLLARDVGIQRDDYVLIDPVTSEKTVIEGELPVYSEFIKTGWGEIGAAKSPDNRFAAVTRAARVWNIDADFSTYLLIVDMGTGETHEVTLPLSTGAVIGELVWRPCYPEVYQRECYF